MMAFFAQFAPPPLLGLFLFTAALAFVAGLGLEQHYTTRPRSFVFSPVRTFQLIHLLAFGLYHTPMTWLYPLGFVALSGFMLLYYHEKAEQASYGLTGSLSAMMIYALPVLADTQPGWFCILAVVVLVLIYQGQVRVQALTARLAPQELQTLARFLLLAGVILPLLPDRRIAQNVPLTPYGVWLAVVAFTAISYAGYLVQTYFLPRRGLMLVGILGGMYSSTSVAVSMARRTRAPGAPNGELIAACLFGTMSMHLRVLLLSVLFHREIALMLAPPLLLCAALSGLGGWWAWHGDRPSAATRAEADTGINPIELLPALFFAAGMIAIAATTHAVIQAWPTAGLRAMSVLVGLIDVDPFILSLLQGGLPVTAQQAAAAILFAVASNNVLKAVYAALFSGRPAGYKMSAGLVVLAGVAILYNFAGLR